jgi:hypothetical protein
MIADLLAEWLPVGTFVISVVLVLWYAYRTLAIGGAVGQYLHAVIGMVVLLVVLAVAGVIDVAVHIDRLAAIVRALLSVVVDVLGGLL